MADSSPSKRKLEKVINSLKSTPFFQEKELGDKEILMLASNIQYLRMSKGSVVFDFGSIGDQFYLIIEGIVSVRTPLTEFEAETLIKTATYRSKVSFFQTEDDEYEYSKFDMVDDQNAEVNKNSTDKPNEDESKSSSMLINKTSFKITNGEEVKEEDQIKLPKYVERIKLGPGKYFGELALIK